ncbi:hypothetical protein, conserved [Eimeria praecox]|uniref:Uncharacterized protein n=1 Tax=Eimeria praecox TaxID=51316 RepID=U6G3W9_9EIME|nr:hypothetical protein, conserved [Eimeria praecox]
MLLSVLLEFKGPAKEPGSCLAAWGAAEAAVYGCLFLTAFAAAAAAGTLWSGGRCRVRSDGLLLLPLVLLLALGQVMDTTAAAKTEGYAAPWPHVDADKIPVQQLLLLCCSGALAGLMVPVKGLLRVGAGLSAAAAAVHLHLALAAGTAAATGAACTVEVEAAAYAAAESEAAAGARLLLLQLLLLMSCTATAPNRKAELEDERGDHQQQLVHVLRCMTAKESKNQEKGSSEVVDSFVIAQASSPSVAICDIEFG